MLRRTLKEANKACNEISTIAFEQQTFTRFNLHHSCYHDIRSRTGLSAQIVIRAIAKVADSYKKDKEIKHVLQTVSIWTVAGRLTIPYVMGASQKELFKYQKGESDLCMVRGKLYLNAACDIPEEKGMGISDMIGVDLGIRQLATTSEEKYYTGEKIEQNRRWYAGRRAALQKVGTKSAKRRLKKLSGKERKFKKDTNHIISKEIVADAKR
ncbi:MAG TPA: transposase, partial [Chitinophagaceae bacterium]|nr:transposase [Chitinophagaceae bacterium]